ncbi:MAG: transglycosylase domain-containing protein [Caldilineaceae bacterium]|nr:transglycosylase domain-containing protein [Caldilineaceae bacterium]
MKIHRSFSLILVALLLAQILAGCSTAGDMVGEPQASDLPDIVEQYLREYQPGPLPRLFQTTYIYDRNGTRLAEIFGEGRRTWVSLDRVSPYLIDATVSTEDATFYSNLGVDPVRVAKAAVDNFRRREVVSGASTITMQLARNLFLGPDQRYETAMDRKVLEAGLAQRLTSTFTKDELMEMYLNLLNYGSLAYGPEAAAQTYFNKAAADLNQAEATFLAGIPQAPAQLNPYTNFEGVKERQRIVLDLMVKRLKLTEEDADHIFEEPLILNQDISPQEWVAPHFVQYTIDSIDARMGDGYTARAGFNLYTTLDLPMQALAEQAIRDQIAEVGEKFEMSNGALIALKPGTSEILVMAGSADFHNDAIAGQVNMTRAPRQPGSAIKPLLFATAFNDLVISPASILWDTPVTYDLGGGLFYRPTNFDKKFRGLVTARSALAGSLNVPIVRLLDEVGIDRMVEVSQRMGVTSLERSMGSYNLSLALGSDEVRLLDLAAGFATLVNDGLYVPPEAAHRIYDSQNRLIDPLPIVEPVQAITQSSAFLVTDILSDNQARTAVFGANSPLHLSVPAAAKTGTTTDWRDNWTMGYTRYLVAGVWMGNTDAHPMDDTTGLSGAAPVWHQFMESVLADAAMLALLDAPADDPAAWDFIPPESVVQLPDCPLRMTCREGGEYFSAEWMAAAGDDGPLFDSYATVKARPVHTNRYGYAAGALYCTDPEADERLLLNVDSARRGQSTATATSPEEIAMAALHMTDATIGKLGPLETTDDNRTIVTYYPEAELERFRRARWALSRGIAVNVGPCDSLAFYQVVPGDNWSMLARRFGLTLSELQYANPHSLRDEGVLLVQDRLLVPKYLELTIGDDGIVYTVAEGDAWASIAEQFEIPLQLLQAVNPDLVRADFILRPGDQLYIPQDTGF